MLYSVKLRDFRSRDEWVKELSMGLLQRMVEAFGVATTSRRATLHELSIECRVRDQAAADFVREVAGPQKGSPLLNMTLPRSIL